MHTLPPFLRESFEVYRSQRDQYTTSLPKAPVKMAVPAKMAKCERCGKPL